MRRSLILVLTALGGSASYAAGTTRVGADSGSPDPSTWRWHVSSILADQAAPEPRPLATANAGDSVGFKQRYLRYSPAGVPEHRSSP